MSASREKKQRQSAGPDQRSVKVQQEQAARKRTTIIYSVIAAVIAVLVAALLIWRSGFFQSRAVAATLGSDSLTTAELSFYYYGARQTTAMYAAYGVGSFDTSKSDEDQMYDESAGKTYRDYFLESALENAQQQKALADEALKNGHTEAEVKESVDADVASVKTQAASSGYGYAAYLRAMYGPYMTAGVYEKLATRYQLARLAANEKYEELYNGYTQADLDEYYKSNADTLDTIEYSHLYFPIASVSSTDDLGNERSEDEVTKLKDEAKAAAKADAETALKAIEGGGTFQSQVDKYDLTTGGDHVTAVGTSLINSTYRDQLLAQNKGDVKLVETDNGYYVICLNDRYLSDVPTRDVRHVLALAENTTDDDGKQVAPTEEAWSAAKAKMDEIEAAWNASGKTVDDFAKLANEKSDDGDGTTGGLYERVQPGSFVSEFDTWMYDSSRQPGDVEVVQHNGTAGATNEYWGYHLIYYVGENEPAWMNTARSNKASDDQGVWVDELMASYTAAAAGGANYLGK